MAETPNHLKDILKKIRDDAQRALELMAGGIESRSLGWKCTGCGHVKHFPHPVPSEVAPPCPECKGNSFQIR